MATARLDYCHVENPGLRSLRWRFTSHWSHFFFFKVQIYTPKVQIINHLTIVLYKVCENLGLVVWNNCYVSNHDPMISASWHITKVISMLMSIAVTNSKSLHIVPAWPSLMINLAGRNTKRKLQINIGLNDHLDLTDNLRSSLVCINIVLPIIHVLLTHV
jgi:hypothetical protein